MKKRVGGVDLLLIGLLLLCLTGAILRWGRWNRDGAAVSDSYILTVRTATLDRESAECLRVGEVLYTAAGEYFGVVREMEYLSSPIRVQSLGQYYLGSWPIEEKCILRIGIAVEGSMRDGILLYEGRTPLTVGGTVTLFSDRMLLQSEIVRVCTDAPSK